MLIKKRVSLMQVFLGEISATRSKTRIPEAVVCRCYAKWVFLSLDYIIRL